MNRTIKKKQIIHTTPEALGIEAIEVSAEMPSEENLRRGPNPNKQQAFELYMRHLPYADIIAQAGVPEGSLLGWVYKERWSEKRQQNDAVEIGELLESKKYKLDKAVDLTLDAIIKSVGKILKDGCSPKELPSLVAAIGQIEKLSRLTKGQATSISEERSKRAQFTLPMEQLKEAKLIKVADPFALEAPNGTGSNTDSSSST